MAPHYLYYCGRCGVPAIVETDYPDLDRKWYCRICLAWTIFHRVRLAQDDPDGAPCSVAARTARLTRAGVIAELEESIANVSRGTITPYANGLLVAYRAALDLVRRLA